MAGRINWGGRIKGKLKGATEEKGNDPIWTLIKGKFDVGVELRRPFERRWILNLAFLSGRQYVFFNQSAHILQQLKKVKGRLRNVDNQLVRRWARQVSDLIATAPIMSVVPETTDDQDIKAAKVGDKVLKAFWRNNKMRKKVRQLGGWIYSCGNAFLDDRWNPKLGPISTDEGGNLVYLGDVDCGVWSPFEILVPFVSFGDTDLHSFPWMIKTKFRQLDWIKKYYPRTGGNVQPETFPQPHLDVMSMMGHFTGESPTKIPGAMVIELYVQPNADFPKGLFATGANGIVLQKSDYPLDHYHIEQFKDLDIPGMFWGKATLEDGIPLQKTWNRTTSSINEFNRIVAKGKGLVPRGAKLDALPDDTHGEWIEYTPVLGHKPEYMTHKGLPGTLMQSFEITAMSLDNLFHQHEVTRGTTRSDLRSGEMARFLREQDARGTLPTHAVFEESMEAVMARVLRRIKNGYTEQRMLKVKGDEGEFEVFAFRGADLRNNTDVSVKRDSSIPDSRLAREIRIKENYKEGLYGDPRDPKVRRRVLTMIDDAETKDVFSEMRLDETYAKWENETIMKTKGEADLLPNEYDNHPLHLEEHNKFRKSVIFQKLRLTDPDLFNALDTAFEAHTKIHIDLHKAVMEEEMAARAKFEAMTKSKEGGGE